MRNKNLKDLFTINFKLGKKIASIREECID